jgi:hypothetical protein
MHARRTQPTLTACSPVGPLRGAWGAPSWKILHTLTPMHARRMQLTLTARSHYRPVRVARDALSLRARRTQRTLTARSPARPVGVARGALSTAGVRCGTAPVRAVPPAGPASSHWPRTPRYIPTPPPDARAYGTRIWRSVSTFTSADKSPPPTAAPPRACEPRSRAGPTTRPWRGTGTVCMAGTRCTLLWTRRQGTDPPNHCLLFASTVHESPHGCMWAPQPCWTNSATMTQYRECMHG